MGARGEVSSITAPKTLGQAICKHHFLAGDLAVASTLLIAGTAKYKDGSCEGAQSAKGNSEGEGDSRQFGAKIDFKHAMVPVFCAVGASALWATVKCLP